MGERADKIDTYGDAAARPVNAPESELDGTPGTGLETPGWGGGGTYANDTIGTYGQADTVAGTSDEGSDIKETRAQIEQTRENMSQTIDAIQEKLSPGNIVQNAKETVRDATIGKAQTMVNNAGDTAKGFGSGFVETIRQNPVPAALAAVGIGWLFMSRKQGDQAQSGGYRTYDVNRISGYNRGYSYNPTYGQYGYGRQYGSETGSDQSDGSPLSRAQDTASNVAGQVQNTASTVASQAQDAAGQIAGRASELANQAGDQMGQIGFQAQQGVQAAQSGFEQMRQSNPLGVGAAALALGLAIGMAIPETEKENELLGPARDNLMQQAQETAQQAAQKVQNVAQEAVGAAADAAKSEAENQGLKQQ